MLKPFSCLLLLVFMIPCGIVRAQTNSLQIGIVATDDVRLKPLQLNQRDVVSVLNLVYEGLFYIDDNYAPQPNLAASYEFTNEGRRLIVTIRDDVSFHNGKRLTSADVVATLDAMYSLSGFDKDLNSSVPR